MIQILISICAVIINILYAIVNAIPILLRVIVPIMSGVFRVLLFLASLPFRFFAR